MSNDLYDHYRVVLGDLQRRRVALHTELREVETLIDGIGRQIPSSAGPHITKDEHTANTHKPYNYGKMSVRWGVLAYLAEGASVPVKTPQIAAALLEGGYQSGGANFANIVSGVLSTLKSKGEVELVEEGYRLTGSGVAAWKHIKTSPKFSSQQNDSNFLLTNA